MQVTTLENGLKVASSDLAAPACTVGLYVATGSAFEAVPGTAHVLQQMAFKSSASMSQLRMVRECERLGASASCTASRENIVYQVTRTLSSILRMAAGPNSPLCGAQVAAFTCVHRLLRNRPAPSLQTLARRWTR